MKKLVLKTVLFFALAGLAVQVSAQQTLDGFAYEIVDGKSVTITRYSGSAETLSIPVQIQGLPVMYIGDGAFLGCSGLVSIFIPSSVELIGSWVFVDCDNLTEITVGSNGAYASIDGVLFDKDIEALVKYPSGKDEKTYAVPSSVTVIGDFAFYNCSSLTNISIPPSVTAIGHSAFQGCRGLTNVTIPPSVTIIGYSAFENCSALARVTLSRKTHYEKSSFPRSTRISYKD